MKKSKDYISQGLLVSALASFFGKSSFKVQVIGYVFFIVFCVISLIRSIKEESIKIGIVAKSMLTVAMTYSLGETLINKFYQGHSIIPDNIFIHIIEAIYGIVMIAAFGVYGYNYVEDNNKEAWLRSIKILSMICIVLFALLGLLFFVFP